MGTVGRRHLTNCEVKVLLATQAATQAATQEATQAGTQAGATAQRAGFGREMEPATSYSMSSSSSS